MAASPSEASGSNMRLDQVASEINQGTGLSQYTQIVLPTTTLLLKEPEEYNTWKSAIIDRLQAHQMTKIIDKTISRPGEATQERWNWHCMSTRVANWLKSCLHPELRERLDQVPLQYAGDVFEAIGKQMESVAVRTDGRMAVGFLDLKLEDFPTTNAFVEEVLRQRLKMAERGLVYSPYHVWVIILERLHKRYPDFSDAEVRRLKFYDKGAWSFNEFDLRTVASELRDHFGSL